LKARAEISDTASCARGDVHTAAGAVDLLKACFAKLPAGVRSIIIRADKGFYDRRLVEWLETQKAGFVIVAKLTGPIKRKLAHLRYATEPLRRGRRVQLPTNSMAA
jgi:hypothetical protein